MGCILSKVCLDEDPLMLGDDPEQTPGRDTRRLSRAKTTLLDTNEATELHKFKQKEKEEEKKELSDDLLVVYGGGVPGVALDNDRVELYEFTGVRDGGYRSVNKRLTWGIRCRAGNDPLRRRKENQDSFCVCDALGDDVNTTFFSVFDGHGPQGAFVSHFIREHYHQAIATELLAIGNQSNSYDEVFQRAARTIVEELKTSNIDISVSGSTAVAMLVCEQDVFLANLGDSRAVVARYVDDEQRYVLQSETKDHKPDDPEECARIEQNDGRVFEWGSYRVWLQDVDMPGLAMSRSFGDAVAKTVGVTAEPDVIIVENVAFSSSDAKNGERPAAFAVLASDGIWEFLTTDECIEFVSGCIIDSGMSPQEASTALVEKACDRWDAEEDVVDDITAIVVFF